MGWKIIQGQRVYVGKMKGLPMFWRCRKCGNHWTGSRTRCPRCKMSESLGKEWADTYMRKKTTQWH